MEPVGQVASSITSLMHEFSTITNNIANSNTAGFKRTVNSFVKQMQDLQETAGPLDNSKQYRGAIESKSQYDLGQGILIKTGRSLDLSLSGKGWFTVETQDGPLYTRNGTFFVGTNGQLVDSHNNIVSGANGPITIPADVPLNDVAVGTDGSVSYNGSVFGQIKIVDFGADERKLKPVGNSNFKADDGLKPKTASSANLRQGYQESSNVNITEELVDLMTVMRMYEANMKILKRNYDTSKTILEVAAG